MSTAIIVGLLAAGGTYLVLQRGIVRIALGFTLLGHAGTVLLLATGGVARRDVPFAGATGLPADPLPQAFALTAIVISLGVTAFLLAIAFRSRDAVGHDDVEDRAVPEDRSFPAHYDLAIGVRDRTTRSRPTDPGPTGPRPTDPDPSP